MHYDIVPDTPNTLDELSNAQLLVIANKYNNDIGLHKAYLETVHDPAFLGIFNIRYHVEWVYNLFDSVQELSTIIMSGGNPPLSSTELVTALRNLNNNDLNSLTVAQTTYIVNQMISYSKEDNTGDWTYYSSQF